MTIIRLQKEKNLKCHFPYSRKQRKHSFILFISFFSRDRKVNLIEFSCTKQSGRYLTMKCLVSQNTVCTQTKISRNKLESEKQEASFLLYPASQREARQAARKNSTSTSVDLPTTKIFHFDNHKT